MRSPRFLITYLAICLLAFMPLWVHSQEVFVDISQADITATGSDIFRIDNAAVLGWDGRYWAEFQWDPISCTFVLVNYGIAEGNSIQEKTELLIGKWTFYYKTEIKIYTLTTILDQKNSEGGNEVMGTNEKGQAVMASYWPKSKYWTLFDDTHALLDKFYMFYTDGYDILSGSCAYLISKYREETSECYPLSGYKLTSGQ